MTLAVETKAGEHVLGTAFLAIREGVAVTAWHVVKHTFEPGDVLISGTVGIDTYHFTSWGEVYEFCLRYGGLEAKFQVSRGGRQQTVKIAVDKF